MVLALSRSARVRYDLPKASLVPARSLSKETGSHSYQTRPGTCSSSVRLAACTVGDEVASARMRTLEPLDRKVALAWSSQVLSSSRVAPLPDLCSDCERSGS